jgi:hypothetical protein
MNPTTASLAFLALLAPAALAAPPAAPSTAVRPYAETSVSLVGTDGATYHVYVGAFAPDQAPGAAHSAVAAVQALRCIDAQACALVLDTRFAIPATALTVAADGATARLATTLRGVPLNVTWTAAAPAAAPGLQVWDTPTVRTGTQRMATAVVTAFGTRCNARNGVIGQEVRASVNDVYATRGGAVPAGLRSTDDRAPHCA